MRLLLPLLVTVILTQLFIVDAQNNVGGGPGIDTVPGAGESSDSKTIAELEKQLQAFVDDSDFASALSIKNQIDLLQLKQVQQQQKQQEVIDQSQPEEAQVLDNSHSGEVIANPLVVDAGNVIQEGQAVVDDFKQVDDVTMCIP